MAFESGTYETANQLLEKIKDFLTADDVGMFLWDYSTDGTGYRLHVEDQYMNWNFRSAVSESSVVDVQVGDLSGIAMNYSTGYNSGQDWNTQPGYTQYDNSTADSVACFLITTSGSYIFCSSYRDFQIIIKTATGVYQVLSFGLLAGSESKTWIYMSGTVSGYLANYSTNGKIMLFGDHIDYSGTDYGSFFLFNGYNQYNTYDTSYQIVAPIDDVTASAMDKFQSLLWESGVNESRIAKLLNPILVFILDTDYLYIGYIRNTSLFNMTNHIAENVIVLGNHNYLVAPLLPPSSDYVHRAITINQNPIVESFVAHDGYFGFSGSHQDYITVPFANIAGNDKTFTFWYKRTSLNTNTEYIINGTTTTTNYERISFMSSANGNKIQYRLIVSGGSTDVRSTNAISADGNWHSVVIAIDHANTTGDDRVLIYQDDTNVTDVIGQDDGIPYTGSTNYKISNDAFPFGDSNGIGSCDIKKLGFFSKTFTSAEVTAFLSAPVLTDCKAFYFGNEAIGSLADPYGDFNNGVSNNYIDMGFKPSDITSTNPFEIVFPANTTSDSYYITSMSDTTNRFYLYNYTAGTELRFYYGTGTSNVSWSWSLLTENNWYRFCLEVVGTDFIITLKDINNNQIGTQYTRAIPTATLPTDNIWLGIRRYNNTIANYYASQIAYIKGNGQFWYVRPATSTTIKSNLGTSLTVNGTLTSFWVNDEPYTNLALDSSGNAYHGTPTGIIPSIWFNRSK